MAVYSLFVINKSGGLIYNKDYASIAKVDLNDSLRLASIWHSINAICCQVSPVPDCSGIELLEASTFDLHSYQTATGTKFVLAVEPKTHGVPTLLGKIYELYSDYALKNPFYEVDMPIRCELFDDHCENAIQRHVRSPGV